MSPASSPSDVHRDDAPVATAKDLHGSRTLLETAVTINRPVTEVFSFFRDFANLPKFMDNIERIDVIDGARSHWVVRGPSGTHVEWDAVLLKDVENELLVWQSQPDADVANSGQVRFHDAGARGTILSATMAYAPPAGVVGKLIAKLLQREPSIQTRRDLCRLKQYLETGEIATAARNRAGADRPQDQN